jgi:hypothetical protein
MERADERARRNDSRIRPGGRISLSVRVKVRASDEGRVQKMSDRLKGHADDGNE